MISIESDIDNNKSLKLNIDHLHAVKNLIYQLIGQTHNSNQEILLKIDLKDLW